MKMLKIMISIIAFVSIMLTTATPPVAEPEIYISGYASVLDKRAEEVVDTPEVEVTKEVNDTTEVEFTPAPEAPKAETPAPAPEVEIIEEVEVTSEIDDTSEVEITEEVTSEIIDYSKLYYQYDNTNYMEYIKPIADPRYGYNVGECNRKYSLYEEYFYNDYYDHYNVDEVYDKELAIAMYKADPNR